MELSRLIQHPEEMNRETLYDLRALLALYPYYQTARLLMLQNLYLLHDTSFDEELRRAAIYISDRRIIYQMVEAAHYQLKSTESKDGATAPAHTKNGKGERGDRTSDLIDHFLGSIPMDAQEVDGKKKEKRKPTPADASVDYVAYLMETSTEEQPEEPSRTITLIDDFIEEGGFKLHKLKSRNNREENDEDEDEVSDYNEGDAENDSDAKNDAENDSDAKSDAENDSDAKSDAENDGNAKSDAENDGNAKNDAENDNGAGSNDEESENGGVFTETLARIYIKQGKYERAHKIIERLYKQHPQKSAYYKDQLRFLEKLILNMQGSKKK